MPNASPIELAQTLIAAVGVMVKIWLVMRAYENIEWLDDNGFNGPRKFWSRSILRQDWMLLMLHLAFFVMGVVSLVLSPPSPAVPAGYNIRLDLPMPPTDTVDMSLQGELRTATFIFASVLLTVFSVWNLRDREKLISTEWEPEPWDGTDRRAGDRRTP